MIEQQVLPPICVTRLGPGNTGPPVSTRTSCRVIASMPTRRSSKLAVWLLLIAAFAAISPGALGTAGDVSVELFLGSQQRQAHPLNRPGNSGVAPQTCTGRHIRQQRTLRALAQPMFGCSCACIACLVHTACPGTN